MALVLGTNTFTMAADASQSQEKIVQDESTSQEGTGTEEVQTQGLEETEESVPELAQEQTEEPGQEEMQGQAEGTSGTETEDTIIEEPGTEEETTTESTGETEETTLAEQNMQDTEGAVSEESTETTGPVEQQTDGENAGEEYDEWSSEQIYEYSQGLSEEELNVLWESLSEEKKSEVQNYIQGLTVEEEAVDYNSLSVEEIYAALHDASDDETYFKILDSLTDEKRQELDTYIENTTQGTTETVRDTRGIVNALMAAPIYGDDTEETDIDNIYNTTGTEAAPGLKMKKELSRYDSESGTGILDLEAFVTGNVYTSTTPLDIVMVLDQSGSMAGSFGEGTYTERQYSNEEAYSNRNNLYVKVGERYYSVRINKTNSGYVDYKMPDDTTYSELYEMFGNGGLYYNDGNSEHQLEVSRSWRGIYSVSYDAGEWWNPETHTLADNQQEDSIVTGDWTQHLKVRQYSYEYSYRDGWDSIPLGSSMGANGVPPVTLYELKSNTRLDSLMDAVSQFATSVHNEAVETDVDHRIAITGFSSSGFNNTEILTIDDEIEETEPISDYNTSYYPTGYAMNGTQYGGYGYSSATGSALKNAKDEWNKIDNAIKALTAHGGTETQSGLQMAVDIFNAYADDYKDEENPRQKIVILFTDGNTDSEGNDVVSTAKVLKDMGATVYTIGIFEGANGNITTDRWGQKVPEEFEGANRLMHLVSSNYPNASRWNNPGELADLEEGKTYFLSASNSDSLDEVFDSIYDEVGGSSNKELDDKTVLYDEISEWFEVDAENVNGIKVYKVPVTSVTTDSEGNPSYTWGEREDITSSVTLDYTSDKKGIAVKGFNYSENFVGTDNGTPRGYKLVLEIPIKDSNMPAFGGNNIPTNEENSGIYNANGETCYGNFSVPMVNKSIDYEIETQDKTVYITTSTSLEELLSYANNYTPDGKNNEFVDIKYQLKLGEVVLGEFVIPAGKTAGEGQWTWYPKDGIVTDSGETGKMLDCTEYSLTCTVTPEEAISDKTPAATVKSLGPKSATIHVLVPTIKGKDQFVFLGARAAFGNENTWTIEDTWTDRNSSHSAIPAVEVGTKPPTLEITPELIKDTPLDDVNNYYPEKDSDFTIAKVEAGNMEITQYCNIIPDTETQHKDCIQNGGKEDNHDFTIHVVGGEIKLYKAIKGDVNSSTEGNAVFTFKVTYTPPSGSLDTPEVEYYTIEFKDNNDGKPALVVELNNRRKGTYIIEELDTQRYDSTIISTDGSTEGIVLPDNQNKKVTIEIGAKDTAASGKQIGVVTYTNVKNSNPGSLTDTDVVVNKFTYSDSNDGYTFKPEELVPVEKENVIDKVADFISGIFN